MNKQQIVATNRKARHNFFIEDSYEAGMVLTRSEEHTSELQSH